jgi:hypothetical protein
MQSQETSEFGSMLGLNTIGTPDVSWSALSARPSGALSIRNRAGRSSRFTGVAARGMEATRSGTLLHATRLST